MALRPYQQNGFDRIISLYEGGGRAIVGVAPTGAGKTVLAVEIVNHFRKLGLMTIFMGPSREIINQTCHKLVDMGIPHGVIMGNDDRTDYSLQVQVATIQTLSRRVDGQHNLRSLPVGALIIDECHHAPSDSYAKVRSAYPDALTLGLTATPYRTDGKGLKGLFQHLVKIATIRELVEQGHLVRPKVFKGPPIEAALRQVRKRGKDFDPEDLGRMMNNPKLVGDIISEWHRSAFGRQTIVFAASVLHSKAITEQYLAAGVPAEHLDGTTEDRDAMLERIRTGETRVISNYGVLTEGADFPVVSCIVDARPTESRCLWRQKWGRGLRPYPGKEDCIILDHAGAYHRHGHPLQDDNVTLHYGVAKKKGAGCATMPITCKACHAVFDPVEAAVDLAGNACCPYCQAPLPARKTAIPTSIPVELTLVDGEEPPGAPAPIEKPKHDPNSTFKRLVSEARAKGYKPGWVGARFHSQFGRWPNRHDMESSSGFTIATQPAGPGRRAQVIWVPPTFSAEAP